MKKIILTGGGTAGHVTPNLALLPDLREAGYEIEYIGSYGGIEKTLVQQENVPFYGIASGKLRRYFSLKNFTDPFRVLKGYFQARSILKKTKADVVFSKGGFVSVPVVAAASHLHIPVIIHESDLTPGLVNKIAARYASKICTNFKETLEYFPKKKGVCTGSPIRRELFEGDRDKGLELCGFTSDKPVVFVMGGSMGSAVINQTVAKSLGELLEDFQIVHMTGKGNINESAKDKKGYVQLEYISGELKDIFAMTDVMISRAGANAICEILALGIPNVLIPLSKNASRGDQLLNAESFKKQGYSMVIGEEELTKDKLLFAVKDVYRRREEIKKTMAEAQNSDANEVIMQLLRDI